ncbi:MAG: hypothetical protein ABIW33_07350 [Sphingomicrobium sp.]
MTGFLFAALLLATAQDFRAPNKDAGISYFQDGSLRSNESIRFRSRGGAGWGTAPAHHGPADRGMFGHHLYDQQLSPGGWLTIEASLVRRGRVIASVTRRLRIEPDRRYDVHAVVQVADPTRGCMGCVGKMSAPVANDSARRLWVYYSFNGISHPILF